MKGVNSMNINTLVNELPDYVTGDLPVALIKNALRSDENGKQTYYGKVLTRKSLTQADIANDLVVTGNNAGRTAAEIVSMWNTINSAIIDRVANGCTVDSGLGTFSAQIKGAFESENEAFNAEKHSIDMGFRASRKVLSILSQLKVLITMGHTASPEITGVVDLESASSEKLTPGGFLNIEGANIAILGESEENGLYFVHKTDSTKSVKLPAAKMGVNSQNKLACVVPPLEAGEYAIKITTQYTKGNKPRKVSQSSLLFGTFTVA